jgi:exo-1,4-beta-D-glucosaminidase
VNGKPILIRGAGWSQDMLLRTDENRLRDQFRLVEDMNLNTIRLEGKLETEEFFHLADQAGHPGDAGLVLLRPLGALEGLDPGGSDDRHASLRSQMLRLRHHASLLVWLNGSDNPPPPMWSARIWRSRRDALAQPDFSSAVVADNGGRHGLSGVKMTGPYDYVAPSYWYVDKQNGGALRLQHGNQPRTGDSIAGQPEEVLPDAEAWPPTANWSYAQRRQRVRRISRSSMRRWRPSMPSRARPPNTSAMAQTMEYDSERAMFEAYSRNKYASTGVIQWMLNNAWPSMIWHLYDYYLDAGAGYFGTKKACEPLHIQYSYDDRSIVVVNSTYEPLRRASCQRPRAQSGVEGVVYAPKTRLDAGPTARIAFHDSGEPVLGRRANFLHRSDLTDKAGKVVSRNFYWVPGTLTTFDWSKTDYTHTPAARHGGPDRAGESAAGHGGKAAPRLRRRRGAAKCACTRQPLRRRWPFSLSARPADSRSGLLE